MLVVTDYSLVELSWQPVHPSNYALIVLEVLHRFDHHGQIVLYLHFAAASNQRNSLGALVRWFLVAELVQERIANILHTLYASTLEPIDLERENSKNLIYIFSQSFHPAALPCPYFWGDVVEGLELVFVCPFGHAEVEAGVVYEYYTVGLPLRDVALAEAEKTLDFAKIFYHIDITHNSHISVVRDWLALSLSTHFIPPPEAE